MYSTEDHYLISIPFSETDPWQVYYVHVFFFCFMILLFICFFFPLLFPKSFICLFIFCSSNTTQKMFSVKDIFCKCDQICSFLRIWSNLQKKSLIENFIFCTVQLFIAIPKLLYWSRICRRTHDSSHARMWTITHLHKHLNFVTKHGPYWNIVAILFRYFYL